MKPTIQGEEFITNMNQLIAEGGGHVAYFKSVLKDYEKYQKVFNESFTEKNALRAIYLFRINYLNKNLIWRDIEIMGNQTFVELAELIIESMGWVNDHMHGFSLPEQDSSNRRFYNPLYSFYAPGWEDDPHPTFKTDEIHICDIDYKKYPKRASKNNFLTFRKDGVIPFRMKGHSLHVDRFEFGIGDFYAGFIRFFIEFRKYFQAGLGCRIGNKIDDNSSGKQWSASPVL